MRAMSEEPENSTEVCGKRRLYSSLPNLPYLTIRFDQKYHDFPETAAEAIASYTKDESGKTVPMWTK